MEAVPSATPAPTVAQLTAPVLPTPTAVDELRSDKGRSARGRWGRRPG